VSYLYRVFVTFVFAASLMLVMPLSSYGDIIVIPDDITDIQDAINQATDGSAVFIKSGIYDVETLTMKPGVDLRGQGRECVTIYGHIEGASNAELADMTIIDDAGVPVVKVPAGTQNFTIRGCTIKCRYTETALRGLPPVGPPEQYVYDIQKAHAAVWMYESRDVGAFVRYDDETRYHFYDHREDVTISDVNYEDDGDFGDLYYYGVSYRHDPASAKEVWCSYENGDYSYVGVDEVDYYYVDSLRTTLYDDDSGGTFYDDTGNVYIHDYESATYVSCEYEDGSSSYYSSDQGYGFSEEPNGTYYFDYDADGYYTDQYFYRQYTLDMEYTSNITLWYEGGDWVTKRPDSTFYYDNDLALYLFDYDHDGYYTQLSSGRSIYATGGGNSQTGCGIEIGPNAAQIRVEKTIVSVGRHAQKDTGVLIAEANAVILENNTIHMDITETAADASACIETSGGSDCQLRNNIITAEEAQYYVVRATDEDTVAMEYNCIFGLVAPQTVQQRHTIFASPGYRNAGAGDFHFDTAFDNDMTSPSIGIDAGDAKSEYNREYQIPNTAVDLGAYGNTKETLVTVVPGDFNGDGVIDSEDFAVLAFHYGDDATYDNGDMNGDGVVDVSDAVRFIEVAANNGSEKALLLYDDEDCLVAEVYAARKEIVMHTYYGNGLFAAQELVDAGITSFHNSVTIREHDVTGERIWMTKDIRLDRDIPGFYNVEYPKILRTGRSTVLAVWIDERGGMRSNISYDYGVTWQERDTRISDADSKPGGYPLVAQDTAGHVYVVWCDGRSGTSDIYLRYSHDGGATWNPSDIRIDSDGTTNDKSASPAIACDYNGEVYVMWREYYQGKVFVRASNDYGQTWEEQPVLVADGTAATYNQIATDGAGHVFAAWSSNKEIYFTSSEDYGNTWLAEPLRLDTDYMVSYGSQMAQDDMGNIYVVWTDFARTPTSSTFDISFNYSHDFGDTWQLDSIRIEDYSATQELVWYPRLKADESGNVAVVWVDGTSGHKGIYADASGDYAMSWDGNKSLYEGIAGDITLSGNEDLFLCAAFYGETGYGRHIYSNWSYDGGITWQPNAARIDRLQEPPFYADSPNIHDPDIACDDENNIFVVWVDHRNGSGDIYFNAMLPAGVTTSFYYDVSGKLLPEE